MEHRRGRPPLGSLAITITITVGLAACGGDDAGVLPAGDPFDPGARAAALAAAICDHRDACRPVEGSYRSQPHAACVATETAALRAEYDALAALITANPPRVSFQQAGFERCLAAYQAATASCPLGVDPRACADSFVGARPVGAACSASEECVASASCIGDGTAACKTCRARAAVGEACDERACVIGAACLELGAGPTCIAATLPVGAACGTLDSGLCIGELQCVGQAAFTCQPGAALGQPCVVTGLAPDCDRYQGAVCNPAGQCVAVTLGDVGSPCGDGSLTLCKAELFCSAATTRCTALPVAGAPCHLGACADGTYCDAGTCRATVAAGQACTATASCSGLDVCQDDVCGPLRYDPTCAP